MKQKLEYYGFKLLSLFFGIVPFRLLYFFSFGLSLMMQYLLRYRGKVISKNLALAFPNKSKDERQRIKNQFYRSFCDTLFETLKIYSFKTSKFTKRINIELTPEIIELHKQNKSIIILMSHYANWEWIITYSTFFIKHKICVLYKPLRNKLIDEKIYNGRKKFGINLFPMEKAGFMIKNNINCPSAFIFIADQNPPNVDKAVWLNFFGVKTAAIKGPEILAKKFNLPVFYLNIKKSNTGKYNASFDLIESDPQKTDDGDITKAYYKKLESVLIEEPALWLWSHRRWKKSNIDYSSP